MLLNLFFALPFLLAFLACAVALWLGVQRYWQHLVLAWATIEAAGIASRALFVRHGPQIADLLDVPVLVGFVPNWHGTLAGILMPMITAAIIAAVTLGTRRIVLWLSGNRGDDSGPVSA